MPKVKQDAVHQYFTYNSTNRTSECTLCGGKIKGHHATNLKNHLASKHQKEAQEIVTLNNRATKNIRFRIPNLEGPDLHTERLKDLCIQLIVIHGRPLAIVNDEPFQQIIQMALEPKPNNKVNVKSIKEKISMVANEVKRKVCGELKEKMVSLKIDSATCADRSFLSIHVQYISNGKLVLRTLAVHEIDNTEIEIFLNEKLREVLEDFEITTDQLYCITIDNCNHTLSSAGCENVTKEVEEENSDTINNYDFVKFRQTEDAVKCFRENSFNLSDIKIDDFIRNYHGQLLNVRGLSCPAHTIQMAIKQALDENLESQIFLDLARNVVRILKKAPYENILRLNKLRKPTLDCPTKWTTLYCMLTHLRELKEVSESITEVSALVSEQFWTKLDNLIKCLRPAHDLALTLQKEQLTVGDFIISWFNCKSKTGMVCNAFAKSLYKIMQSQENQLLEADAMLEALYLDSRLNVILSNEQCDKARSLLNQTYRQLLYISKRDENVISPSSDGRKSSTSTTLNNDLIAIDKMLTRAEKLRGISLTTTFEKSLLELRYAPRLALDEDIIAYWGNKPSNSKSSNELSAIANVVLSATLTQYSVIKLFSHLKFLLSPLRSHLSPQILKNMLLIRANNDFVVNNPQV